MYSTALPAPPYPAPSEDDSILGSIHTTRPSAAPAAMTPPSLRHDKHLASAPSAMDPTPLDAPGALTSSKVTRPSPHAAATRPDAVGEKDACQHGDAPAAACKF